MKIHLLLSVAGRPSQACPACQTSNHTAATILIFKANTIPQKKRFKKSIFKKIFLPKSSPKTAMRTAHYLFIQPEFVSICAGSAVSVFLKLKQSSQYAPGRDSEQKQNWLQDKSRRREHTHISAFLFRAFLAKSQPGGYEEKQGNCEI